MSDKSLEGAVISAAVALTIFIFLFTFLAPVALVLGGGFLTYKGIVFYRNTPTQLAKRDRQNTEDLHARACSVARDALLPTKDEFLEKVILAAAGSVSPRPGLLVISSLIQVAVALYEQEKLSPDVPAVPSDPLAFPRYRDTLIAYIKKVSNPSAGELLEKALVGSFATFLAGLPPHIRTMDNVEPDEAFAVAFVDLVPDIPNLVEELILPFYSAELREAELFTDLRQQLDRNADVASGAATRGRTPKFVLPSAHEGAPREVAQLYLTGTPFLDLFTMGLPFALPQPARLEHHWIVAGSGHGKTQTLQYLIARDLDRVARGDASLVVIDSQGDLIRHISRLKFFAEHPDKLCLIDPTDIEYPVALNLFDVGMERINKYSPLDRERLINGVIELYDFVLGSLLSAEMTQKQSVIFRYITRLMLHIPDATIQTLRELLEPDGYEKYRPYVGKLQGTARAFFETEFNSKQFEDTKRQVVRRLWGILENPTFERMFSHPRNKLDLFTELNSGKVILINTAKELLKQQGTELFGRFFIAMIAHAAQERATLPESQRLPTFVYVDEAADYFDQHTEIILREARKQKVGMILAHQYIGQLSGKLPEALDANTSIKFAGGVSDKDARAFAHMMRTTPETIESQPKGHFAAFVRNTTDTAIALRVPFGYLEKMPRMTREERRTVRARMREKYAVHHTQVMQHISERFADQPEIADPDNVSTEPKNWG